jgi:CheY-like chemotaxis protein
VVVAERILIVEDEPEFAALLELWIGQAGYESAVAASGTDGLRSFYDVHPDLVLLDVSVPGLDGWQVIERIREFSRVPIIMVTARSGEADKVLDELTAVRVAMRRADRGDLIVTCVDDAVAVYREAMAAAGQTLGTTAYADPGELEAPEG